MKNEPRIIDASRGPCASCGTTTEQHSMFCIVVLGTDLDPMTQYDAEFHVAGIPVVVDPSMPPGTAKIIKRL